MVSVGRRPLPPHHLTPKSGRPDHRICTLTTLISKLVRKLHATFEFEAELYEWSGDAAWVFVALPVEIADEIRDMELPRRGFGSVKVRVRIGDTEWRTSVFPDKGSGSYVLPVKKAVRHTEKVDIGDLAEFEIDVAPE
jgi:hypothetical protein